MNAPLFAYGIGYLRGWIALFSALICVLVGHAASWTELSLPTSTPLRTVRYLNGQWFALGNAGTLLVSPNGLSWTQVNVGTTVDLTDIAWGNGTFILVSHGSRDSAQLSDLVPAARFLSQDGLTWSPIVANVSFAGWAQPFYDNMASIDRITFAEGRFVALAAPRFHDYNNGEPRTVITTLDGRTWSTSQSVGLQRLFGTLVPVFDVLTDAGVTVIAGHELLASTKDGATWVDDDYTTDPWHNPSPFWDQVDYFGYGYRVLGLSNNHFVALGLNMRAESADGVHWQKEILATNIVPLTFHAGVFYGRASDAANTHLFYSADGRVWKDLGTGPAATVDSLTIGNTEAVATSGARIFRISTADLASARATRLLNISFRGRVGSGEDIIIGGFVVGGDTPMRVLIRGVGPGLAKYGVANPLSNPKVILLDAAGAAMGNNDNWGQAPDPGAVSAAAAAVGAFPLVESSNDAAMLVTLNPGVYTVQVVSVDGSSGVALGEIYEVP